LRGQVEQSDYPEVTALRCSRFVSSSDISRPDLLLGVTTGQLESFASAARLSSDFGSPLVLEYRDPLPHPGCPPLEPSRRSLLSDCVSHASLIITTTEGLSESVAREFPRATEKVRTIYSCYDDEVPASQSSGMSNDRLVLVHAGTLHGGQGRNSRSLVKAIAEAVKTDPGLQGRIQLCLIGAAQGGVEALELASQLNIPWSVELLPQMSHKECLARMSNAQVLVVIKFDDPEYDLQVPGKTFQYLGRGKPILGIMRETEAARILRRSGIGIVKAHSDVAGMAEAIMKLWHRRNELSSEFIPDWDYIRRFSLTAMSEKFDREFSLVAGGEPAGANAGRGSSPAELHPAVN
jgi:glycosyltransferase involved in cell wall biosynthesis